MIFCSKCFCDPEIKIYIENINQNGNCTVCGSLDVYVYDTEKNSDLVEYFDEFLSIYTPAKSLPAEFPRAEMNLLKEELLSKWNIFNKLNSTNVYNIITSICSEKYKLLPDLFDTPVGIAELYNPMHLSKHSLLKTNKWEDFVTALKIKNRFHTNLINLEILERFCSYIRKPYKKGTVFFRGRIASPSGIATDKMGAPSHEFASAGRANAPGISCLYLANDVDTTIHEVRAGAFDYISVGAFELQEDILVVDFKSINRISPFIEDLDYMEHAINKEHLNKINDEMGKTLRRSDSDLDYIPTQYISDFIKSIEHNGQAEYAGIEYKSTMNKDGYNLAIFNPNLFQCVEVKTFRISELNYRKETV